MCEREHMNSSWAYVFDVPMVSGGDSCGVRSPPCVEKGAGMTPTNGNTIDHSEEGFTAPGQGVKMNQTPLHLCYHLNVTGEYHRVLISVQKHFTTVSRI